MPKTTYRVTTPDGAAHTRKSDRAYTHAIAILTTNGGWNRDGSRIVVEPYWSVLAFAGTPALAEKRAHKARQDHGLETLVIPVEVA